MTLYELTKAYSDFAAAVENGEIPEEAIADTFDMLEGDLDDKIDNTACAIKNLNVEIKGIDDEIKALMARKKSKENSVAFFKDNITRAMQSSGKDRFETARNKIAFRKSERLVIADEAEFAGKYPEFVTLTPKISKTDVKAAVKSGRSFDGAQLVEAQNIQIK